MPDASDQQQNLEERVKNLELFVIGILKAFQPDGRVNPEWLAEVRGCIGANPEQPEQSPN